MFCGFVLINAKVLQGSIMGYFPLLLGTLFITRRTFSQKIKLQGVAFSLLYDFQVKKSVTSCFTLSSPPIQPA
jgi:hypothetical protein